MKKPSIWIDTNVLLEVYSHVDLLRAFRSGVESKMDQRRLQLQGSLWMGIALSVRSVLSVNYADEGLTKLRELAPPGTDEGMWTSMIIYVLMDGGMFKGWERVAHNAGRETLTAPSGPDKLMVELCREHGLILITRDAGATRRASRVGVTALSPEAYAQGVITRDVARRMFFERLPVAIQKTETHMESTNATRVRSLSSS